MWGRLNINSIRFDRVPTLPLKSIFFLPFGGIFLSSVRIMFVLRKTFSELAEINVMTAMGTFRPCQNCSQHLDQLKYWVMYRQIKSAKMFQFNSDRLIGTQKKKNQNVKCNIFFQISKIRMTVCLDFCIRWLWPLSGTSIIPPLSTLQRFDLFPDKKVDKKAFNSNFLMEFNSPIAFHINDFPTFPLRSQFYTEHCPSDYGFVDIRMHTHISYLFVLFILKNQNGNSFHAIWIIIRCDDGIERC